MDALTLFMQYGFFSLWFQLEGCSFCLLCKQWTCCMKISFGIIAMSCIFMISILILNNLFILNIFMLYNDFIFKNSYFLLVITFNQEHKILIYLVSQILRLYSKSNLNSVLWPDPKAIVICSQVEYPECLKLEFIKGNFDINLIKSWKFTNIWQMSMYVMRFARTFSWLLISLPPT